MIIKIALDTASPNRVADIAQVIESTLGLLPEQAIVVVEQGGPNQNPGTQGDTITVSSRVEFKTAFEKHRDNPKVTIVIDSPSDVWIPVIGSHRCGVEARGESSVEAYDRSRVSAYNESRVEAYNYSSVVAYDESYVEAWDSSSVEDRRNAR